MKHYKRTIKRIRKSGEWQERFLLHIGRKFEKSTSDTLNLSLIHIKRRFFSNGLLETLLMQQLADRIAEKELQGDNVINFNKYKR